MGKKYIIELEEAPFIQHFKNGAWETIYRVKGFNSLVFDWNGLQMLTPYTEPDMEQVRKEAYGQGLSDAWEAARKITGSVTEGSLNYNELNVLFGSKYPESIINKYSASEAIEKIRQYEQEKDRLARIEYNFDEIKDVLETTVKECNVSLDEIAEVLRKMGETNNG